MSEAKQSANADMVSYAQSKVATVRRLHRTRLPIPHAGDTFPPKPPIPILDGLLTFESDWSPALGPSFETALLSVTGEGRLESDAPRRTATSTLTGQRRRCFETESKPATAFLFQLISQLQFSGTVPMIYAYGRWLTKREPS